MEVVNAALAARHTIGDKSGISEKAERKNRLKGSLQLVAYYMSPKKINC